MKSHSVLCLYLIVHNIKYNIFFETMVYSIKSEVQKNGSRMRERRNDLNGFC